MPKVKAPLLSFKAHGSIGKQITYQDKDRGTIVRTRPVPTDPQSDRQLWHRYLYEQACQSWHTLSAADKQTWETNARPCRITGFNLFMRGQLNLLANLKLCLPLNEGAGLRAFDYSSNLNHAVLYGPSWTTWYDTLYSLIFDGSDDYANCSNHPSLNFTGKFTFSFWLKPDLSVTSRHIFNRGEYLVNGYDCLYFNDGSFGMQLFQLGGARFISTPAGSLTHNIWQFVAFTRAGVNGKCYVNMVEKASPSNLLDPISITRPFLLGCDYDFLKRYKGQIAEFSAFDTSLGVTQLTYYYERRSPP